MVTFKEQSNLFIEHLKEIQPPIYVTLNIPTKPDKPGNWFICFAPMSWGCKVSKASSGRGRGCGSGPGIDYTFKYARNLAGSPFVRLYSGGAGPFKEEFRDRFRKDASEAVRSKSIPLPSGCRIWPGTTFFPEFRFYGTYILECQPVPLEQDTWRIVLDNYKILSKGYNEVVAQLLRKYYSDGAFKVEVRFD